MEPRNLNKIFGKFAGRELLDPKRMTCEEDPVIEEMQVEAAKNSLTLQVLFPNTGSDCSFNPNRVNAVVEKGADGKYRVSTFDLG